MINLWKPLSTVRVESYSKQTLSFSCKFTYHPPKQLYWIIKHIACSYLFSNFVIKCQQPCISQRAVGKLYKASTWNVNTETYLPADLLKGFRSATRRAFAFKLSTLSREHFNCLALNQCKCLRWHSIARGIFLGVRFALVLFVLIPSWLINGLRSFDEVCCKKASKRGVGLVSIFIHK